MQIRRDNSLDARRLTTSIPYRPRDRRHRRTAPAEHPFEVDDARPDRSADEAVQLLSLQSNRLGEVGLSHLVFAQVSSHGARDLILDAGGSADRIWVVRAGPWRIAPGAERDDPADAVFIRRSVRVAGYVVDGGLHTPRLTECFRTTQINLKVPLRARMRSTAHVQAMNASIFDSYQPAISKESWSACRDFVIETIQSRYGHDRSEQDIKKALSLLTGFADWALNAAVGYIDATVLTPEYIDAYRTFRGGEVDTAFAERERKTLYALAGERVAREARPTSTTSRGAQPYSRAEQDEIVRWTERQSTDARRRTCRAMAALGLGCGVSPKEMLHARRRDIITLADGMPGLAVDGREVPVTIEWSDALRSLVDGDPDEYLVAPGCLVRRADLMKTISARHGQPAPTAQRMRATWLLAHVDGGTPLNTLIEAAGLGSEDFLRRLLPYAERPTGAARLAALRLSSGGAR